jgi:peptidoglycan hydrolase-like protein with peptidoglycan-binding domain
VSGPLPSSGKRWGKRVAVVAVVVVFAGGGVGAYAYATRRPADTVPRPAALPTKPVVRGDLVSSVQLAGRLGYAGSYTVVGARPGTVTSVPRPGDVINRGQRAYAVDLRPIPLLFGAVPFYRPLSVGVAGPDVRQLKENLIALGYATPANLKVDNSYTPATAEAVRRWQHALGVEQSGTMSAGDAVIAPGPIRVTAVDPLIGQSTQPGQAVLTGTGVAHNAHVDVQLSYRSLVSADQAVRVQLPNGRTVDGKVSSVGTATGQASNQDQAGTAAQAGGRAACQGSNCPQAVPVDIQITSEQSQLGGVYEAPVTVTFPAETHRDVLSVPIEALTAGPDRKYVIVVVDAAGRRTVPVQTGMFTSGRVEISGDGIAAGMQVEVPSL